MLNQVNLLGRVGRIETKDSNGKPMTSMSIATSKGTGEHKKTEWHNCIAFGKTAETLIKYVKVGDLLFLEGSLSYRKYTPKGAEKEVTTTSILVDRFTFTGGNKDDHQSETTTSSKDDEYSNKVKSAFSSFGTNPKPNIAENLNMIVDDIPF